MSQTHQTHLLDLHSELVNDTSGTRRNELLARLRKLQDDCLLAKRQPTDRESFRQLHAAAAAVTAALRIVEKVPGSRENGN